MTLAVIFVAALLLAYANGANDNFKGVATLFGSGTGNYRRTLAWATVTTLLGSATAIFLAERLLRRFSGKGLVDDLLVENPHYAAAVALGAGFTVLLATRKGLPVSTTHSLVGALVGAGLAAGSSISFAQLGWGFFAPLLVSPVLALALTVVCYPLIHRVRRGTGITEETCFCVGSETITVEPALSQTATLHRLKQLTLQVSDTVTCRRQYSGRLLGLEATAVLDRLHYFSAGTLSFARGLNDTPKIAALLLLTPQLGVATGTALVGLAIASGGLLSAARVAETMSHKVTEMNHGQGFTANAISSVIVIGASRWGLPVSTTHVTCGALFGLGAATRQGHLRTISTILGAWLVTLPFGAALGLLSFVLLDLLV